MIVGLTGYKQSGKSTVAAVFSNAGFFYAPFALPLKNMMMSLLFSAGVDPDMAKEMLYGSMKETPHPALGGRTARYGMQTLGTEWGRQCIAETFWVDTWKRLIRARPLVITDDVRFPNEAEAIHALHGIVLRVDRAGTKPLDEHSSEVHIADLPVDGTLLNDGDLAKLSRNAHDLMQTLIGAPPDEEPERPA